MGLLTRDAERRILKWLLVDQLDSSAFLEHPVNVHLMSVNGSATMEGVEIIGDSYMPAEADWVESSTSPGVEFVNASDVIFDSLSTETDITVVGAELWDSSDPAVRIGFAAFTDPVLVEVDDPLTIGTGQLKVHLT